MEEVSVQKPSCPAASGGGITLPGKELLPKTANLDGLEGPLREAMELKDQGAVAFKRAQLMKKTTASKQFLGDAKAAYAEALQKLSDLPADDQILSLVATLHSNLAAVFLALSPPSYVEAKAAAEIALSVPHGAHRVKAHYRRALALLEDEREGLPEENLRAAMEDLQAALDIEPQNASLQSQLGRISRRIRLLEQARAVPSRREIADRVSASLLNRGGDCLLSHGYVWGQTEAVLHIFVPVQGMRVTKAKDVECEIRPNNLRLTLPADKTSGGVTVVEGQLHKYVQPDESTWQLEESGLLLHVELAKRDVDDSQEHWASVFIGHPQTLAPTAREQRDLKQLARAACIAEEKDPRPKPNKEQEAVVNRLREMCPGVPVEWGDTSAFMRDDDADD